MASNLRSLFAWDELPSSLREFKDHLQTLLGSKYRGGLARDIKDVSGDQRSRQWDIKEDSLIKLTDARHATLSNSIACDPPMARCLMTCTTVSAGNVSYQPASQSRHNCRVLYRSTEGDEHVGLIRMVFSEATGPGGKRKEEDRIFLIIK